MKRRIKRVFLYMLISAILLGGYWYVTGDYLGDYFFYKSTPMEFFKNKSTPIEFFKTRNIEFMLGIDSNYYEVIGFKGKPTDIEIPSKYKGKPVMYIAEGAFYNCSSLKSVTVPQEVMIIGNSAFKGCNNLESITIPFVGESAEELSLTDTTYRSTNFSYIFGSKRDIPASLNEVIITGGSSISMYAFDGCSNITKITLPNSIKIIGESAFYECQNLKYVYYSGTAEEWKKISIGSYNEKLTTADIYYSHAIQNVVYEDNYDLDRYKYLI